MSLKWENSNEFFDFTEGLQENVKCVLNIQYIDYRMRTWTPLLKINYRIKLGLERLLRHNIDNSLLELPLIGFLCKDLLESPQHLFAQVLA